MTEEKGHSEFDKGIRDKIITHKSLVSEDLWPAIETTMNEVDKKNKRRVIIFWWAGLSFMLFSAIGVWLYWGNNLEQTAHSNNISYWDKPYAATLKKIAHSDGKINNPNLELDSIENKNDSNGYATVWANTIRLRQTINHTDNAQSIANTAQNKSLKNQHNGIIPKTVKDIPAPYNKPALGGAQFHVNTNEQDMAEIKYDFYALPLIQTLPLKDSSNAKHENLVVDSVFANGEQTSPDSLAELQEIKIFNDTAVVKNLNKQPRKMYVELAAHSTITSAYFRNTGLELGQHEEIVPADGFGLYSHVGLQFNKRIEFYTGLNFEKTELEQRLNTAIENFNFQTVFGEVHIEEDENEFNNDLFFVERYFYYLEIPVGIRYHFIATDKWMLNIKGDFLVNYLINQTNRNEAYIKLDNQGHILPVTLSCAGGLGVQYNFRKGYSVITDVRYSLMLNSISSDDNVIVKPYSYGIGIGIKKYF